MAKVKISKKSTRIDMTAMCDVAFLLLSFFIMSATAKQPEPKAVDIPASTVIDKLPEEGVAVITVGGEAVFFTMPQKIREATLRKMSAKYRIPFTAEEYKKFAGMDGFGVPMNQLNGLLRLEPSKRNEEGQQIGIPYKDSVNNQLGDWVKEARQANKEWLNERLANNEKNVEMKDLDLAIKGDAKENFTTVKKVIDILQDQKKNKFFLVTNLRGENF